MIVTAIPKDTQTLKVQAGACRMWSGARGNPETRGKESQTSAAMRLPQGFPPLVRL